MNNRIVSDILFKVGWFWLAVGCMLLFFTTTIYFSFRDDIHFLLSKPDLVHDVIWRPVFYVHVVSGMLCIAVGPFQFLPFLRRGYVRLHRNLGKVYVMSILLFAAPTGLYMALFANGGFWSALGFFVLSLLWWTSTFLALRYIKKGDVARHRQFMAYSFALTFSAVTLRVWVALLGNYLAMDMHFTIVITAWINWIPNLLVAHLFVKIWPQRL